MTEDNQRITRGYQRIPEDTRGYTRGYLYTHLDFFSCSYTKHVTAPPAVLSKQVLLTELILYPNAKGHGPFHVACGSCSNSEWNGEGENQGENQGENEAALGAHSRPPPSTDSTDLNDSTHKEERLRVLTHFIGLNKGDRYSHKSPVVDVNAR